MITRRSFIRGSTATAGAVAGLAALPGCGGGGGSTSSADEITFLNWDPIEEGTPLADTVAAFEEESGTTVAIQPAPASDYDTKLLTVMASGSPPDVVRINDDFVLGYSQENQLLDLNPYLERDGIDPANYFDHPFSFPIQADGKHTAWATGTQPNVVFYNVDLFKEAGLPLPPTTWTDEGWKWDDFLEAAKALTVPDERFGALVFDDTSSETTFTVNNGTDGIYSKDGTRFTLADPKSAEGIQWIADLTLKHQVQPTWSRMQSGADTPNFALSMFANGEVAMMTRNFGSASWLAENIDGFEWDIAPIPGNVDQKTISTLIVWAIPAEAGRPDEAWEMLKYFTDPDGSLELASRRDLIPANRNSAEEHFQPDPDRPPANLDLVLEAVENGVNENFSPNIQEARAIYKPQLDLIFNGDKSAEDALGEVRDQVEDALAGNT